MLKTIMVVAAAAGLALVAGCSNSPTVEECQQAAQEWAEGLQPEQPPEQPLMEKLAEMGCVGSPAASPPAPASPTASSPVVVPFGEPVATSDGAQVTVLAAEPVEVERDRTQIPGQIVKVTFRVVNNSGTTIDPRRYAYQGLSSPGGHVQSWAFGRERGFREPGGDLFPGESVEWDLAVEMEDPTAPLRIEVDPERLTYIAGVPGEPVAPSTYTDPLSGADEGAPPAPPTTTRPR